MNRKLIFIITFVIVTSLGFGIFKNSVNANFSKELPPEESDEIDSGELSFVSNGLDEPLWTMIDRSDSRSESRSEGGPDDFGYTWSDSEPFSWIDTSGGTDTGLTGMSYEQGTGPIDLPFTFNFYGFDYSQIYIAASGYTSFSDSDTWPWQQKIPSVKIPNNIIAPYWSPNEIIDGTGWVKYDSGGSEPNRYFVVEWHDVSFYESNYTFQMILYEDGDIVFQFGTMVYSGVGAAGGIEDQYGSDGLPLGVDFYFEPLSNSAIRISRPENSARIGLPEKNFGAFTKASDFSTFDVVFTNIGDLGSDIYNLTSTSTWDVNFYDDSGGLLTDTNGDSIPDTGSIPQGSGGSISVKIHTPATAIVGDENEAEVIFTSTVAPTVNGIILIKTALPYPFAQSYALISEDTMHLDLFHPQAEFNSVVGARQNSMSSAIAETKEGFVYLTNAEIPPVPGVPGYYVSEILLTYLDRSGNVLRSEKLTDHSGETFYHRDSGPTVVTAPNGKIGIGWSRTTYDAENGLQNSNVYMVILDEYGNIDIPVINVTNNTKWGTDIVDNPAYGGVLIDATPDNRFAMVWGDEDFADGIYTAIFDSEGAVIQPMTNITWLSQQTGHTILALDDGNIFLAFFEWDVSGFASLHYMVFDNSGSIIKPKTTIAISDSHVQSDSVQLSDGTIILSWIPYGDDDQVKFMSFDSADYEIITNPDNFSNPMAQQGNGNISLTPTEGGQAILTWSDSTSDGYENSSHLFYALMDSSCNLTSGPMIFKKGDSIAPLSVGYSNTNFSGVPPVITSADNTTFTEGTFGSFEITASGVPLYPAISTMDILPGGVSLVDNGDGAATLSGTPSVGTGGLHPISLSASNGVLPDGRQEFTLKVNTVINIDSSGGVIVNHNGNTEVTIPENAVVDNTEFVFEPLLNPTESTGLFRFGGISFNLTASDSSGPVTEFIAPINIKIGYDEALLGGLDEEALLIYYWNEDTDVWEDAACSEYTRNLDDNWFSVDICHLSEFAVLGEGDNIFLPLILR